MPAGNIQAATTNFIDGNSKSSASLLKTGALQAAIFNSANFSSVATDAAGIIQIFNVGAEQMLGYTAAEVTNKITPADISDPEELIARANALSREFAASIAPGFEALVWKASRGIEDIYNLTYIRKDGSRFPAVVSVTALRDGQDAIIGYLLIGTDNTARKQRQDDQLRDAQRLRDQKSQEERLFLAAIVDSSDDAIISKTLTGIITSWNDSARRLFGYAADEIIGRPIAVLIPAGRENEEAAILKKLAGGQRIDPFDTVRTHKDGHEVHVSVTMSPVRDAAGNLVGASKIVRDVTARWQADKDLAQAREIAVGLSRELEAFSYSVAHELRAPLRGMNGFAAALREDYGNKLDRQGLLYLEKIGENAVKMGHLIDSMLALARVTRVELRSERVDMSSLAREIAAQLAAADTRPQVAVIVQDVMFAQIPPALARTLLENFLGNAWKFTRACANARIEFGCFEEMGLVTFFVRDNGAGFDMAYSEKLFAPFQRLHSAREFPGTGVGMATAQRIIQRGGGRIWAQGVVGAGATFFFTIPAHP